MYSWSLTALVVFFHLIMDQCSQVACLVAKRCTGVKIIAFICLTAINSMHQAQGQKA
jgi:hypothetical protein